MTQNSKGIAVTVAIVAAIGVSLLAMLAVLNRKDQTVGLNQEIQYDDFAFSVQGVRRASSLGAGEWQTNAQGVYCVVTLKIANHAKRVDFTFKKGVRDSGRRRREGISLVRKRATGARIYSGRQMQRSDSGRGLLHNRACV